MTVGELATAAQWVGKLGWEADGKLDLLDGVKEEEDNQGKLGLKREKWEKRKRKNNCSKT